MRWDIPLHQTSWWLCPDSLCDAWVARGRLEGLERAWPPVGHFFTNLSFLPCLNFSSAVRLVKAQGESKVQGYTGHSRTFPLPIPSASAPFPNPCPKHRRLNLMRRQSVFLIFYKNKRGGGNYEKVVGLRGSLRLTLGELPGFCS